MSANLTKKNGAANPEIIDLTGDSSQENSPTGSKSPDQAAIGKPLDAEPRPYVFLGPFVGQPVPFTNSPCGANNAQSQCGLINALLGEGHLFSPLTGSVTRSASATPITRDIDISPDAYWSDGQSGKTPSEFDGPTPEFPFAPGLPANQPGEHVPPQQPKWDITRPANLRKLLQLQSLLSARGLCFSVDPTAYLRLFDACGDITLDGSATSTARYEEMWQRIRHDNHLSTVFGSSGKETTECREFFQGCPYNVTKKPQCHPTDKSPDNRPLPPQLRPIGGSPQEPCGYPTTPRGQEPTPPDPNLSGLVGQMDMCDASIKFLQAINTEEVRNTAEPGGRVMRVPPGPFSPVRDRRVPIAAPGLCCDSPRTPPQYGDVPDELSNIKEDLLQEIAWEEGKVQRAIQRIALLKKKLETLNTVKRQRVE